MIFIVFFCHTCTFEEDTGFHVEDGNTKRKVICVTLCIKSDDHSSVVTDVFICDEELISGLHQSNNTSDGREIPCLSTYY